MSQNWVQSHTIFLTIHGSQSFGMATAASDVDLKGVCIPPKQVREDIFHKFDQAENAPFVAEQFASLRNPLNPKMDSVIYSLRKYVSLAALVNPTILELMWVDKKFVKVQHPAWNEIVKHRKLFLTRKVRQTYLGYAKSQLSKIMRHKKWLKLDAAPKQPTRDQFGLQTPEVANAFREADRFIRRQIELWNFTAVEALDDDVRHDLKETCWDLVFNLCQSSKTDWENWPDSYYRAALVKLQNSIQMPKDVLGLVAAEKNYQDAMKEWVGYQHWLKERNEQRRELERNYGFDTKHASHLVRLLRQGLEVMQTGELTVLRPDAAELLSIRNGAWSYEKTVEYAAEMENRLEQAEKTTPLPQSMDKVAINEMYHSVMGIWEETSQKLGLNTH